MVLTFNNIAALLVSVIWSVCIVTSQNIFEEPFTTTFSSSCLYYLLFTSKPVYFYIIPKVSFYPPSMPLFILFLFQYKTFARYVSQCLTNSHNLRLPSASVLSIFLFMAFGLVPSSCAAVISNFASLSIITSLSHSHFCSAVTSLI